MGTVYNKNGGGGTTNLYMWVTRTTDPNMGTRHLYVWNPSGNVVVNRYYSYTESGGFDFTVDGRTMHYAPYKFSSSSKFSIRQTDCGVIANNVTSYSVNTTNLDNRCTGVLFFD